MKTGQMLRSDYKKPDAITDIMPDNFKSLVWPLPASDLLYVGKATSRKLTSIGITTIGGIAKCPKDVLCRKLGKWGEVLWLFANGLDSAPVRLLGQEAAVKSVGNGITCPRDLTNNEDVQLVFTVLAESVAARLRDYNLKCTGVEIQIRDKNLYYMTRQQKISRPTFLSSDIIAAAMQLFRANYRWFYPVRAVALRGINLVTADTLVELSLFEDENRNLAAENLARTIDGLRKRFGHDSILRASRLLDRTPKKTIPYTRYHILDKKVLKMPRIELDIIVEHRKGGLALPKTIIWDDGRRFDIDRVLDIRKAAATKCGGIGIRYICRIRGREYKIFDEDGKWFIEH